MHRSEWGAALWSGNRLKLPAIAEYVVLHHTCSPTCEKSLCYIALRRLQEEHIKKNYEDIVFNFVIAPNGDVYEGRGLGVRGQHSESKWNDKSYGIAFIGDYRDKDITDTQKHGWEEIIKWLVKGGFLNTNYKLIAQPQTANTSCPGDKLYSAAQKWPHYESNP